MPRAVVLRHPGCVLALTAALCAAAIMGPRGLAAQEGPPGPTARPLEPEEAPPPPEEAAPPAQPAPQPAVQPAPQAPWPASQPAAYPQPPAPRPAAAPQAQPRAGRRVLEQANRHALGVSAGMAPGTGFAYRYYLGNTALQGAVFAMVLDRGEYAVVWSGLSAAHYLLVWHKAGGGILPQTSALRLVGGVSHLYSRDVGQGMVLVDPDCKPTATKDCDQKQADVVDSDHILSLGAGIGVEFGAVMEPGFSLALDLALTGMFSASTGFDRLWPLPSIALMYSW